MSDAKTILVTGGAGYIGSHCAVELLTQGFKVVIVDNLCNSDILAIDRISQIAGSAPAFYPVDMLHKDALNSVFVEHEIDAVIHFAGLKAVGESVEQPLHYYQNNLLSTLNLLDCMIEHQVYKLVFSSSATVYGPENRSPYTEDMSIGAVNPYGQTKVMIEQILKDAAVADARWYIASLRYFNPVGAHKTGLIGESPSGIPNNLTPYISQVAVGRLEYLNVYGDDYPTVDGTGVRDYIHITDLIDGHVKALAYLNQRELNDQPGWDCFNLGTGKGTSVLEMVSAFEKASGKKIPYKISPRRPGDLAEVYANADKAERELGWKATRTVEQASIDSWRWQSQNPKGFV